MRHVRWLANNPSVCRRMTHANRACQMSDNTMNPDDKCPEIQALVRRVLAELGSLGVVVVDHWEVDLMAIGFAAASEPRPLAYVSSWHAPKPGQALTVRSPNTPDGFSQSARTELLHRP